MCRPSPSIRLVGAELSGQSRDALAGRLYFDAPTSFLRVPADTLNEVCRFSDPVAYRLAIVDLQSKPSNSEAEPRLSRRRCDGSWRRIPANEVTTGSHTSSRYPVAHSSGACPRRTTFRELRESFLRDRAMLRLLDRSMSVVRSLRISDTATSPTSLTPSSGGLVALHANFGTNNLPRPAAGIKGCAKWWTSDQPRTCTVISESY